MTFVRPKARILEISTTSGNGPYALGGAVDGSYNTFASFMAVGDTTYASVVEPGVAFWTGIITYSATNQITLTTVEETKGTFGSGTKELMSGALASTSMFREDVSGAILTGGTSTAYTVASYRKYDTLTRLDGNLIAFTPHATNTNAANVDVTISIDGLAAKPIRAQPGVTLPNGTLILGTPYLGYYNNTDGVLYLHNMINPYVIPISAGFDYWGPTAPNNCFAIPNGQAISRTTYASLFSGSPWSIGTTYGSGDGSTTFNLPDKTGRVSAMKEASASRLTSTYFGGNSTLLGAPGGGESHALSLGEAPIGITSTGTISGSTSGSNIPETVGPTSQIFPVSTSSGPVTPISANSWTFVNSLTVSGSASVTSNNTGGAAHRTVQPTIISNYIMRVI